ncbi:MAG: zf-TFIIB domain-containing protein [Acidimicrobiales bacterium]
MLCPVDGSTLLMSERQGVEIDYCPECRGVWLDRGELDKLIQREDGDWDDRQGDQGREREWMTRKPPSKKKKWLSEMFEFGGD